MPTRKRHHGFTIVELIVTMSILGLMLFLVNQLFNDTSVAVTTSVQTSKTIAASRSINEQLTADMDAMIGPGLSNDGGYIVIIQQRLPNVAMIEPQTLTETTANQLRSDQIVFIRDGEGLKSMTPKNTASYGTSLVGQPGGRAKVWYGHALRTLPNGQKRTGTNINLGEANAKLDRIGSNFILGRQAILFNPTDMSLNTPIKISANQSAYTHANSSSYAAVVSGSGFSGTARTYMGLTDVTVQEYGDAATTGTLLYQLSDTLTLTVADHTDNYINTSYPVADNRLRVNTAPDATATNFASWAIAQGHPILAQGCSEIIIDFAADLNGNGRIDRQFGGGTDDRGAIWWYDSLKQGNLAWVPLNSTQPFISNLSSTNQRIFIFRVDDDQPFVNTNSPGSKWPYLIRIRYRLHDSRGRLTGNYNEVNVDNDGDGTVDEAGDDKISGRWFERIIAVPRP